MPPTISIIDKHEDLLKSLLGKDPEQAQQILRDKGYCRIIDYSLGAFVAGWSESQAVMVGVDKDCRVVSVLVTEGSRAAMFSKHGQAEADEYAFCAE